MFFNIGPHCHTREHLLKGKAQYFLVPTCLDHLLYYWKYYLPFCKTSYLDEEINGTKTSLSLVFLGYGFKWKEGEMYGSDDDDKNSTFWAYFIFFEPKMWVELSHTFVSYGWWTALNSCWLHQRCWDWCNKTFHSRFWAVSWRVGCWTLAITSCLF